MQKLSTDIRYVRSESCHMMSVILSFLVKIPAHQSLFDRP